MTMDILIIGGTRNLGHLLTYRLLEAGHRVTVFNRGQTPDELPDGVTRLRGDRSDAAQLKQALSGRFFDAVVDTTLYNGPDAQSVTEILKGRVGSYVFISTGQVYLVRLGLPRPFKEEDYARGEAMVAPPAENIFDYENWLYGVDKRAAEDVLATAWAERQFPFVSLRLPIVHSERDHFGRIYSYFLRLQDGGPILLPSGLRLPMRHIYVEDAVQAMMKVLEPGAWTGRAFNIAQDETLSLEEFLSLLAEVAGYSLRTVTVERALLESHQLLPGCSPFSGLWMSEMDNYRSKVELELAYTPVRVYLEKLVTYYRTTPPSLPAGYQRRAEELELAALAKEI
ncbi:MAG TPA: NAD-dependent epimerase/dehydratase family protein [Anaerolineae bacterium]|nr:NAD-dependent epimerase/dehydratase family protein [Anaerolineae bacterium]